MLTRARLLAAFCLIAVAPAIAQNTTGAVEGSITDQSQAAIPKATVKLINRDTRVELTSITNASGYFLFDAVPVGVYEIAVNHPGFKPVTISGIKLDISA